MRGADPDLPQANTAPAEIYGLGVEPDHPRGAVRLVERLGDRRRHRQPDALHARHPEAKQAIESFFQLGHSGVVPSDQDVEAEDDESRFVNGRLAMLLDSRRAVPSLREAAKFDWDVASLPYFQNRRTSSTRTRTA